MNTVLVKEPRVAVRADVEKNHVPGNFAGFYHFDYLIGNSLLVVWFVTFNVLAEDEIDLRVGVEKLEIFLDLQNEDFPHVLVLPLSDPVQLDLLGAFFLIFRCFFNGNTRPGSRRFLHLFRPVAPPGESKEKKKSEYGKTGTV